VSHDGDADAVNLERWRADTPGVAHVAHFNNAGAALMPQPVIDAVKEHLALEAQMGGYEAAAARAEQVRAVYASVGALIGANADDIALTASATDAYARALSSIPFTAGDVVVTTRSDYVSNVIQFQSLAQRFGVDVVTAPDGDNGVVDVGALADIARSRAAKLIAVSHVPTHSGRVQDVAGVGAACRDLRQGSGCLYLVDACQSVGQMPVDVADIGCDFLSVTSRKFLRGPRGVGFLYVNPSVIARGLAPLFLDLHSAHPTSPPPSASPSFAPSTFAPVATATRFEDWEFNYGSVFGLGAAVDYALGFGMDVIGDRIRMLSDTIRERVRALAGAQLLDEGADRCAIVPIVFAGKRAGDVQAHLAARRINVSLLSPDYQPDNAALAAAGGAVRVSPHCYNSLDEVDALIEALAEARGQGRLNS